MLIREARTYIVLVSGLKHDICTDWNNSIEYEYPHFPMYLVLYHTTCTFVSKLLVHTIGGQGHLLGFSCFSKASRDSRNLNVIGVNLEATWEAHGSVFTKLQTVISSIFKKFTTNHVPKTCLSRKLEKLLMKLYGPSDLGIFFN